MEEEVKFRRKCNSLNEQEQPCGNWPITDETVCFWHSPNHQEAARQARVLGGRRRRTEQVTQVVFDLNDLTSLETLDRIFAIATLDTLQLENSPARSRALIALMKTKLDMNKHTDLDRRIAELQEVTGEDNDIKL